MKIKINIQTTAYIFYTIAFVVFIINIMLPHMRAHFIDSVGLNEFFRWIDANSEFSFPAWYSSTLLLVASIVAYCSFRLTRTAGKYQIMWLILSFGFLFMSVDEASSIHEHFGLLIPESFDFREGSFASSWVAVSIILVMPIALAFIPFLLNLPVGTSIQYLIAGFIYLSGAVILEIIGARVFTNLATTHMYHYIVSFEELLEMVGVIIFIIVSINFIKDKTKSNFVLALD